MRHRSLLLTIANDLCDFDCAFAHLEGKDRLRFLAVAKTSFLHVKLKPVEKPTPRRENHVAFLEARIVSISALADWKARKALDLVEHRFPAFCLGYSILDADGTYSAISTITHRFRWPSPDSNRPSNLHKTINLIPLFERMWALEAQEEHAKREERWTAQLSQINTHGDCWMAGRCKTAGEEVERLWSQNLA